MSKVNTENKYNLSDEQLHNLFIKVNDIIDFKCDFNYQFSLLKIILEYYDEHFITDDTPDEIFLIINEFQKLNNFYLSFSGILDNAKTYLDDILNKQADIDEFMSRCEKKSR